jgi:HlyD family secretion protein
MSSVNSTISSLAFAFLLGCVVCLDVPGNPLQTFISNASAADEAPATPPRPAWAASATGRVEPKDGLINIGTQIAGRIADVSVKINDRVQAGDLLIRLEEDDLMTRVNAAAIEVQVRERERDEEIAKGVQLERRQAEDSVATAERGVFRARLALDELAYKYRANAGPTSSDLDKSRTNINLAKEQLANARSNFVRVASKDGLPLATRVESSLASSRAELALAEAAVERARIRAPSDGAVLNIFAKFGELVAPAPDAPLIVFGDLRGLRVRAEVEERDATKIALGQRVVIRGDAFPGREFEGQVTSIAQAMSSPRIATRGVRRPNDVEVIEVIVVLDSTPPLLSGMRVDVFFKGPASAPQAAASTAPKTN